MKFNYPIEPTQEGRVQQQESQVRPNNFGKINSAAKIRQTAELDRSLDQVRAKARVQRYMNDPENRRWTDQFMDGFGQTAEGQRFVPPPA